MIVCGRGSARVVFEHSCALRGKMARMKFPGTNKSRSSPEKEKKLNMFGRRKKERFAEKQKGSVIRPAFISHRRYREIFGDSDEEVLHSLPCTFQCFVYRRSPTLRFSSNILIFPYCRKKNSMAFEPRIWVSRLTALSLLKIIWTVVKEWAIGEMALEIPTLDIQQAIHQNCLKILLRLSATSRR